MTGIADYLPLSAPSPIFPYDSYIGKPLQMDFGFGPIKISKYFRGDHIDWWGGSRSPGVSLSGTTNCGAAGAGGDLPPAVVPSFKLVWGSSQARDPGGA